MIRTLVHALWVGSRERAMDAGRVVGDPDGAFNLRNGLTRVGFALLLTRKERRWKPGKGGQVRGLTAGPGGHHRWICTGCGAGGMKPDLRAARSDADRHAAVHGFAYRYGLEDRPGQWPANAMRGVSR